jgi:hypothetical protein
MHTRFRVGYDNEGTYVWDRKIQPECKELCLLWCYDKKMFGIYETRLVKAYVKTISESALEILAIESYRKWDSENGANFFNSKRSELINSIKVKAPLEKKSEELNEKHRMFLREKGLPDNGVRSVTEGRSHRVTHCWNCKGHLDNTVDVECATCGWIICNCGACGCGR